MTTDLGYQVHVELGYVVTGTAAAYAEQAEAKQIRLNIEAQPELGHVEVDPERMAQVLGNLVSNALRYTPEDGQIRLFTHPAAPYIHAQRPSTHEWPMFCIISLCFH
ncbi:cell wall metabolism sensor histidine kinase WalK [Chloroflexi bacterium TSY]|nr:cell wall metabolism sensor histidine kinase WalK [Chloroflexi bacterium TSY]